MRRSVPENIKGLRAWYTVGQWGYTCARDEFLEELKDLCTLVADSDVNRGKAGSDPKYFEPNYLYASMFVTDGTNLVPIEGYEQFSAASKLNWLDNFLNIPVSFEREADIMRFVGGTGGVPFTMGGTVESGSVDMSTSLINPVSSDSKELTVYPGYISLNEDVSSAYESQPIQVDVASNKYEDGNLVVQVQQERRNKQVDEQLDKIFVSTVDNVMVRMFELLNGMSDCSNFKIQLSSGRLIHQTSNTAAKPTFNIGSGVVYVRDTQVAVQGTSASGAFDLKLRVVLSNPSGEPLNFYRNWTVAISTAAYNSVQDSVTKEGSQTVIIRRIGGVRRIEFEFDNVQYYTYKIERSPCDISIPPYYVAADGILYAVAGGTTQYALSIYDCDELKS